MSVTNPTLRFLPGAVLLLEELDELDELELGALELLEVLELLELLPHAARVAASTTAPIAASPNHLILAFTGLPFAAGKTQR
jgi:hypothetical protein